MPPKIRVALNPVVPGPILPARIAHVFVAESSSQAPHANRLLVAADRYVSERDGIDIIADRLMDRVGYQELRPEFLVEALDSGGQIHRVAAHGVFLAPRRADVASHHLPKMQSYADTQRPITADIVLLDRGKHFARGRDGAPRRVGIVERRTKQRQEAVPEKLVHDAAVAIDDLDQYGERCVQSVDNLLRHSSLLDQAHSLKLELA